jgi:hypothetical protein
MAMVHDAGFFSALRLARRREDGMGGGSGSGLFGMGSRFERSAATVVVGGLDLRKVSSLLEAR